MPMVNLSSEDIRRIKGQRVVRMLTSSQVAEAAHISLRTYTDIEAGLRTQITESTYCGIVRALWENQDEWSEHNGPHAPTA